MKILIIGDSCRDVFVYCDAIRLAPDVPVPVLNIVNEIENPGMAKNVHRNIISLGANCDILTNSNWYNITKTRYIHNKSNHSFFRVDSRYEIDRIDVNKIDFNYDLIAISDYDKGFLKKEDIEYISKKNNNIFIDTKKILGDWIKNVSFIKINNYEYSRSIEYIKKNKDVDDKIINTMAEQGCFYRGKNYPVKKVEVKDASGAGDTFFAALVFEYSKNNIIEDAIRFANDCASKIVQHKGVGVI